MILDLEISGIKELDMMYVFVFGIKLTTDRPNPPYCA